MYNYEDYKEEVISGDFQPRFLKMFGQILDIFSKQEVATMTELTKGFSGDGWKNMAVIDRLVEINYLVEIHQGDNIKGQFRLFRLGRGRF